MMNYSKIAFLDTNHPALVKDELLPPSGLLTLIFTLKQRSQGLCLFGNSATKWQKAINKILNLEDIDLPFLKCSELEELIPAWSKQFKQKPAPSFYYLAEKADKKLQQAASESGLQVLKIKKLADVDDALLPVQRVSVLQRETKETKIDLRLNLDGSGKHDVLTGLHFFDHMLDQLAKHSGMDLKLRVKGDLEIDEHHTIEDTAIAIGEALSEAIGDKRGMARYGFCLPMDEALALCAIDFSGRTETEVRAQFKREYVGDFPTELFAHFFKSLAQRSGLNLILRVEGENEHHIIEAAFKSLARSIKMAVERKGFELPSTKGLLQ